MYGLVGIIYIYTLIKHQVYIKDRLVVGHGLKQQLVTMMHGLAFFVCYLTDPVKNNIKIRLEIFPSISIVWLQT